MQNARCMKILHSCAAIADSRSARGKIEHGFTLVKASSSSSMQVRLVSLQKRKYSSKIFATKH